MRCFTLAAFACLALTTVGLRGQDVFGRSRDLNRRGDSVNHLEIWVDAGQAHQPGIPDEGTRRMSGWTLAEFEDLRIELKSLLKLMEEPRTTVFNAWIDDDRNRRNSGLRRVVYSGSELERLRRMARAAGGRDHNATPRGDEARVAVARNRLVKRGAAMHTTMALNRPEQNETRPGNPFVTPWTGIVQFSDGQQTGLDGRANHWMFARGLLDLVTPAPSRDNAVRGWYRASCAALLGNLQLHADHFEHALRLFPDDPLLLMLAGSLHEALSSASVQAFIRSATLPRGVDLRVGSTRTELSRAEQFYRRAVNIDPRAAEARVRLGRVLNLQERYSDALTELTRLDASAPMMLQYYEGLFAGQAFEALNRVDDARLAYERAAAIYPRAQTPRLALSHHAMRSGDSRRAREAIELMLSPASEPVLEDDPFWVYYIAPGRDADLMLAQAYRALSVETSP